MRRRNRNIEAFSLSFLDCICCGFGAIILLLVLSKVYEPAILEKTENDLNQLIAALQEQLFEIRGDTVVVTRELGRVQLDTSETKLRLQTLQKELNMIQGQYALLDMDDPALNIDEGDLHAARQRLTEEMMNLRPFRRAKNDAVGGIPVDRQLHVSAVRRDLDGRHAAVSPVDPATHAAMAGLQRQRPLRWHYLRYRDFLGTRQENQHLRIRRRVPG